MVGICNIAEVSTILMYRGRATPGTYQLGGACCDRVWLEAIVPRDEGPTGVAVVGICNVAEVSTILMYRGRATPGTYQLEGARCDRVWLEAMIMRKGSLRAGWCSELESL